MTENHLSGPDLREEGSRGLFSLFHNLEREQPLEGIKVNVGGRALEDLHGIDVVANLERVRPPSPLLLGILVK